MDTCLHGADVIWPRNSEARGHEEKTVWWYLIGRDGIKYIVLVTNGDSAECENGIVCGQVERAIFIMLKAKDSAAVVIDGERIKNYRVKKGKLTYWLG